MAEFKPQPDRLYEIASQGGDLVMSNLRDGAPLVSAYGFRQPFQLWTFREVSGGFYQIVSQQNGHVVSLGPAPIDAPIYCQASSGDPIQHWTFREVGDGLYQIVSQVRDPRFEIDSVISNDSDGYPLFTAKMPSPENPKQQWTFREM